MPKPSHIGIIGAGATGLAAGYYLAKAGQRVTILERNQELGGLAASINVGGSRLERYYHHLFASDKAIISLIHELGLGEKLRFQALPTGIYYDGQIYPFGTPAQILSFPPLPMFDRLRFAASSAYLKATSNWHALEQVNALTWTKRYAGATATKVIWEPLLRGKFGLQAPDITMAWLWARVHFRTFELGYLSGGFDQVYIALADQIKQHGGTIRFSQDITKITQASSEAPVEITLAAGETLAFDRVISTTPQPEFARVTSAPPADPLWQNRYLGATCFILELDHSLIPYYWLNINDPTFPFLAVVEHTHMVDTSHYGNKHIVYLGNYLRRDDWRFTEEPSELLKKFLPYLKQLNPKFEDSWITKWHFSRAPFAQPIVTSGYAAHIPPHETALPGVTLATMSQVYPQDRGQNYAVQMAHQITTQLLKP